MPTIHSVVDAPRWAVVSTYPPTACGLATFTLALTNRLTALGAPVDVVRVLETPEREGAAIVAHHLVNGSRAVARSVAAHLNQYDVVVLQHEYGIYGGQDGADVLDLYADLSVPVITVLHTVLATPSPQQRRILREIIAASDELITMTHAAKSRVVQTYDVDPLRVHVIPHGAPDALVGMGNTHSPNRINPTAHWPSAATSSPSAPTGASSRRPTILTWGLIGSGKGIEWGIEAMAQLRDLHPSPRYIVAGRTHPKVIEREGEKYRRSLEQLVGDLRVSCDVTFDDRYLDAPALHAMVRSADVVLLPYDSREQSTSGVLIEAVAAGRPVVSTRFPHALELLEGGAGLLVDQRDPNAIAAALRRVLTEPGLARTMSAHAESLAGALTWTAVANRYLSLGAEMLRAQRASSLVGERLNRARQTAELLGAGKGTATVVDLRTRSAEGVVA